jgi:hypothetical protein
MINGLEGTFGRNLMFGEDFDVAQLKQFAASAVAGPEASLCTKLAADFTVPPTRDLTIEAETNSILDMATAFVKSGINMEALGNYAYNAFPPPPANILAALKNAESFELMKKVPTCHLSVSFPCTRKGIVLHQRPSTPMAKTSSPISAGSLPGCLRQIQGALGI